MSALLKLLRSHDTEQSVHDLLSREQYTFAERFTGVADGVEVVSAYVGNPTSSGVHALTTVSIGPGGLTHIDTTDGASVDTAGADMPSQSKGANGGDSALTVEYGGSYSATGTTLNTIAPGTSRDGGPATTQGGGAVPDVRLLLPGDAVVYTATNQSGGAADFDITIDSVEIDR
jgi:hypothetical protein